MESWNAARRNRLVLVLALILLVAGVLWIARGALFPYIFALVVGYLMLPVVNWLDRGMRRVSRRRLPTRPVAILVVYALAVGLGILFFSMVVPVISQQFSVLWEDRAQLIDGAQRLGERFLVWYEVNVPIEIQTQIADLLQQAAGTVARAVQTGVTRTFGVVTSTVSFVLGMIVVPFWLFYILHDQTRMMRGLFKSVPPALRSDVLNIWRIVDDTLGAYLRGQLLLCVFIGVMATAGLSLLGVRSPAVLGLVAGIFEIFPFIGPIIGLVPTVIVASIQSPALGFWTFVLFVGIQQVENLFLVPRISGRAVQLHPALIMVVLVIGNELAGLWGMLLAVPATAIVRDTVKYLYLRFQDEPVAPRKAIARLGHTPLQLDV